MQVLVNKIKGSASNGKSQEYGHATDGSPLGVPFGKAQAADPPASPQDCENRQDMPGEHDDRQWQVAQPDGARDQLVKYSRLKLQSKEFEVVRIQIGIEVALDGGKIDAIVLHSRVIAVDQEGEQGQDKQNQQDFASGMGFQAQTL